MPINSVDDNLYLKSLVYSNNQCAGRYFTIESTDIGSSLEIYIAVRKSST